jgi:hypothetical protein
LWFYNAVYETEPELSIHVHTDWSLKNMAECMKELNDMDSYNRYMALYDEAIKGQEESFS